MTAGTAKKKTRKTGKRGKPSSLPSQYDFTSRNTEPPPPPHRNRGSGPSVSDYPPPTQLFREATATTLPRATSTPLFQPAPPPQPRGSQTSASVQPRGFQTSASVQPREPTVFSSQQSPISSEAQNSETDFSDSSDSDGEASEGQEEDEPVLHVEPNLSKNRMKVLNILLSQPGRESCTFLSPTLEPGTTWFGRDKSKLSRKITKVLQNKFNAPFYSWKVVPQKRRERFLIEFAKRHTWNPIHTGLVQEKFEEICLSRLKDMVSRRRTTRVRPKWIRRRLWEKMVKYWDTAEAIKKSKRASVARMSDRGGLGPHTHNSGQKSYLQIEQEMVEELGRPVTIGEVFIKTHTKKDGTFVDKKAKKVAEAYQRKKQAKLADLSSESSEGSDGTSHPPQLSLELDNELFLLSTFTDKRGRHYGIGSLESTLVNGKRKYNVFSSSPSYLDLQTQLDKALQKIEEQVACNAKLKKQLKKSYLAEKYLSETDPKYLAFIAAHEDEEDEED